MILINHTTKELISINQKPDIVESWLCLHGRWGKTDEIN